MTGQTNLGSWRRSSSAIRHRHVNFLATTLVILIKQAARLCSQTETKVIIMTRKLLMIGITLVGLTMAFGSNAWAENGRSGKDRRNDKAYHQNYKTPSGHHYGWEKGKKEPTMTSPASIGCRRVSRTDPKSVPQQRNWNRPACRSRSREPN